MTPWGQMIRWIADGVFDYEITRALNPQLTLKNPMVPGSLERMAPSSTTTAADPEAVEGQGQKWIANGISVFQQGLWLLAFPICDVKEVYCTSMYFTQMYIGNKFLGGVFNQSVSCSVHLSNGGSCPIWRAYLKWLKASNSLIPLSMSQLLSW